MDVAQGEHWTKVIGPFFLFVNSGKSPPELFKEANAQVVKESQKWPYGWVTGVDYPKRTERATVSGRIVLRDPQAKAARMTNLRVGLTYPAYTIQPLPRPGAPALGPRQIDWQTDAKHYEFWVRSDENGRFRIPNVRPGKYTLHALADGVLGEFGRTGLSIESGTPLHLGTLEWTP